MYLRFSTFFSSVQESPWYTEFLTPVVEQIVPNANLLDIGTGSGKLLQLAASKRKAICTGTDTDSQMLDEAVKKLNGTNARLIKTEKQEPLPFSSNSFDCVTICNLLFLLDDKSASQIIDEAFRVLKPTGKLIVLTPTGANNIQKLAQQYHSIQNLSIYLWYLTTKRKAREWTVKQKLLKYSRLNNLKYKQTLVLQGFAEIGILEK